MSRWECRDGIFGFPDHRDLEPGVLNDDAIHVFTYGHCHSFAEAVRRLVSAAKLIFAFDVDPEDEAMEDLQGHLLVLIEGRYLDARGWIDELLDGPDAKERFEGEWDRVEQIGREGWLSYCGKGWLDLRVDDALPFALALLEQVGVPIDNQARPRAAALKGGS